MFALLVTLAASTAAVQQEWHPALDSDLLAHVRRNSPLNVMTVSNGAPVSFCSANITLNQPFIRNWFFMDHITSFGRERTVGRNFHTQGSGAMGYFEVTHDISQYCKADFLNEIGKQTPVAVRFSQGTAEQGNAESAPGINGFAVKFKTKEGNFDLPGIHFPCFVTKNPADFIKYGYKLKKAPAAYLYDSSGLWDLLVAMPEALNTILRLFSAQGIPKDYRHMPGYNVHTLQVENAQGETFFMRWQFQPDAGKQYLSLAEAAKIAATDPTYYTRDLNGAIEAGDYPSWTVYVQIATEEDIKKFGYSTIFDITRSLSEKDFPMKPVGKMVLNRNPKNHFAEIEQLAFCVCNVVNGIVGGPDRMCQARQFIYRDSALHRLGPDFKTIPANCPINMPNFDPNSYDLPVQDVPRYTKGLLQIQNEDEPSYNSDQVIEYWQETLTSEEQDVTAQTMAMGLGSASSKVQEKVIERLNSVLPDLATRILQILNASKAK